LQILHASHSSYYLEKKNEPYGVDCLYESINPLFESLEGLGNEEVTFGGTLDGIVA